MNILVNGIKVDALCSVVHRSIVQKEGREWAKRLREAVSRQQYEVRSESMSRRVGVAYFDTFPARRSSFKLPSEPPSLLENGASQFELFAALGDLLIVFVVPNQARTSSEGCHGQVVRW